MGYLDKKIIINRLAKIKYLYKIGVEQSMQEGTFAGFSILSFHDCVEMFLLLVLEDRGDPRPKDEVKKKKEISFMGYWDCFKELTLKESMNLLKERRRNIKHKGIFPSKSDVEESRVTITQFFRENTKSLFKQDFDTISLADLIEYPQIKKYVQNAESALSQDNTYDCLVNARVGFEELLSSYESNKRQWRDSIFYVGEKVGMDYRSLVANNKDGLRWFEQVTKTTNAVRNILKVTALGIDYKKYALFDFITPNVVETCGIGEDKYAKEPKENFESTRTITPQDCHFCINFVIDSALKLQEFDFSISKYLEIKG